LVRADDFHGRRRGRSGRLLLGRLGTRFDLATLLVSRIELASRALALVGERRLEPPALGRGRLADTVGVALETPIVAFRPSTIFAC